MKKIISLTKFFYKVNSNNSYEKLGKNKKILLYIIIIAYVLYVFVNFWSLFVSPLKEIGKADFSISLILNISNIFIFMTSAIYIANILYFSNDIQNILAFPFKPKEIFTAKLLTVYFYELAVLAMVLIPAFISYAQHMDEGILFYLFAFIIFIMIPIIPIALITLIYMILLRFFNLTKYKNVFKILSTVLLLVVIFSFQMNLNNNMSPNGEYNGEYILEMCENLNEELPYYLKVAINTIDMPYSINKIISLLWYIIINFVFAIAVVLTCSNFYIKSVDLSYETKRNKKIRIEKVWKNKKSQVSALFNKEIKVLFRNTTFFIQCILPTFLIPIIIIIMSWNSLDEIAQTLNGETFFIKLYSSILMIEFFLIMNHISITAISRDGKDETLYLKALPIDLKKLIKAKIMPSVVFGMINVLISLVYCYKIFALKLIEIIILIIIGILLNLIQSYLFIIIDLKKPKIYWESELAVVKQNMNIFYGICVWVGIIIATSLVGSLFINTNSLFLAIAFISIFALTYALLKLYICKNKEKLFNKIF